MTANAAAPTVEVIWKQRRLRSDDQIELGRLAALQALEEGKSRRDAARACIQAMYQGNWPLFDGFVVMIDGEAFE